MLDASWRVIGASRTALWPAALGPEARLVAGKVENLRVATARLGRRELAAGQVFSFWRHVGRPSRRAGFVIGRELREGCLVPSVGGGLCQLSNALYDAALSAGLTIVERHAHSAVVAGSLAERGRDATVFFPYVDLRFTAPFPYAVEARMSADELVVEIFARSGRARRAAPRASRCVERASEEIGSCHSCGVARCSSYAPALAGGPRGETAFLLDRWTPEHDAWVSARRREGDLLFVPADGGRRGRASYRWATEGFAEVREHLAVTLARALASRRLAEQGAQRQRALLSYDARLAAAMARGLDPGVRHLVVQQTLLPHLERLGALGGRTVDVLATRLPLAALHARLDAAARRHPRSPTIADFRAPAALVEAERRALTRAARVVTPHAEIARCVGPRVERVAWARSVLPPADRGAYVVTLGPIAARRGALELREALRGLGATLRVTGRDLEGGFDFGVPLAPPSHDPLAGARVVVAPAWVEHEPRALLSALDRGVPVIASRACGLGALEGVTEIAPGDVAGLRAALCAHLEGRPGAQREARR